MITFKIEKNNNKCNSLYLYVHLLLCVSHPLNWYLSMFAQSEKFLQNLHFHFEAFSRVFRGWVTRLHIPAHASIMCWPSPCDIIASRIHAHNLNFINAWVKIFMTTVVMKISTPWKLPAIQYPIHEHTHNWIRSAGLLNKYKTLCLSFLWRTDFFIACFNIVSIPSCWEK